MDKPRFRRFRELRASDAVVDLHMHTTRTDGNASAAEMVRAAEARGLAAIAITDHADRESVWFAEFQEEIRDLRRGTALALYAGVEVEALDFDGTLDATPEMLQAAEVVIGSVHWYPVDHQGQGSFDLVRSLSPEEAAHIEAEAALGLLRRGAPDILGHPLGLYLRLHQPFPSKAMARLAEVAAAHGVAMEISAKYLDTPERLGEYLEILRRYDPLVSFGSDAHRAEEVGRVCDAMRGLLPG